MRRWNEVEKWVKVECCINLKCFVFYAHGSQFLAKSTLFLAGEFLFNFLSLLFFKLMLQARADLRVIKTHREGSL